MATSLRAMGSWGSLAAAGARMATLGAGVRQGGVGMQVQVQVRGLAALALRPTNVVRGCRCASTAGQSSQASAEPDLNRKQIDSLLAQARTDAERRELISELYIVIHGAKNGVPVDAYEQLSDDKLRRELRYLMPDPRVPNTAQALTRKPRFESLPDDHPLRDPTARPDSQAYFTGNSVYYDLLQNMDDMLEALDSEDARAADAAARAVLSKKDQDIIDAKPDITAEAATTNEAASAESDKTAAQAHSEDGEEEPQSYIDRSDVTWLKRGELEAMIGSPLRILQYREIISRLHRLRDHPLAYLIERQLSEFMRFTSRSKPTDRKKIIDDLGRAYATGRRKDAVARVWVWPGTGQFKVNRRTLADYFGTDDAKVHALQPFAALNILGDYDIMCTVKGGGYTGQAGAIRLGISRCLETLNPEFRPILKKGGFLTRDARVVERKKPGQKKARRKFQWVKR